MHALFSDFRPAVSEMKRRFSLLLYDCWKFFFKNIIKKAFQRRVEQ
jgi:hypothetical protein